MVQNNDYDSSLADIRRICGAQGTGKSLTAVALVVDDNYSKLTGIISPEGEYYKAKPLNEDEIHTLKMRHIVYNPLKHIRLFSNTDNSSKITTKPNGWMIESPVKTFTNFNLYGIRYKYIDDVFIIENINNDIMNDAWVILDESVLTDKQDTMSKISKMIVKFGAQIRKRRIHLIIIAQTASQINSRFNLFATTVVECSYDKDTHIVDLEVNKTSPYMESTSFYAPDYWKFYRHDELVKVPQHKVDKMLTDIYNTSPAKKVTQ